MKKVLVFGVFDKFHLGHESFLEQAKLAGGHLTVCVAQDKVIRELKGKLPSQTMKERIESIKKLSIVDKIIVGDVKIGSFKCINLSKPDIIAFGYDQDDLKVAFESWLKKNPDKNLKTTTLPAHKPDLYKTSLL